MVIAALAATAYVLSGNSSDRNGGTGSGTTSPVEPSKPFRLLAYGGNPLQQIRAYPAAQPNSPLVVILHGGAWHSEPNEAVPSEAMDLNQAGFAVFDVNYRSFTAHGAFPEEIDDAVAATRYAIAHAKEFNANPHDVTMIGGSAGGQLVASASQTLNSVPGTVDRVVTLSAPTDFATILHDGQTGLLAPNGLAGIEQGLGCTAVSCSATQEDPWSPALSVTSSNCPSHWLIINGTHELIPVDQAQELAASLRAHGCDVTLLLHDSAAHAYAAWPVVRDQVIAFVKAP